MECLRFDSNQVLAKFCIKSNSVKSEDNDLCQLKSDWRGQKS